MELMIINKKWLYFIIFFMPTLSFGATIKYNLTSTSDNPKIVQVSVDTSHIGVFSIEQPRQLPFSSDTQVPQIQCITMSGRQKAEYGKEVECREITWFISFDILGENGTDVSKQQNLYSLKGWWVLFEWGDIPRLKGYSDINICASQLNTKFQDTCRTLPANDSAPLILVWGDSAAKKSNQKTHFNLYVDDLTRVLKEGSWAQVLAQFNYLQQLLLNDSEEKKDIDIVWIGIDESIGVLGGAAGSQAYISNYAVKGNQVSLNDLSRLYWISGHEEFHMLSSYSFPTWISESLAHYYGFKSLSAAGFSTQSPIDIWKTQVDKFPHSNTGLYKAHEMVVESNEMNYYGLFYNKGAAFWNELDEALIKKGSSLDLFISFLPNKNNSLAQLNKHFVTAIEKVLEKDDFSRLASNYLL
jgi:hypothetical protein